MHLPRHTALAFIALLAPFFLAGCRSSLGYMGWQYHDPPPYKTGVLDQRARPNPVVVIPGIISSTLVDPASGEEQWFGPWHRMIFSSYDNLALTIDPKTLQPKDPELKPGDLPRKTLWFDFYGSLFDSAGAIRRLPVYGSGNASG